MAINLNPEQVTLYIAMDDDALYEAVMFGLPHWYNSHRFKSMDELLQMTANEQPALILCHNELLDNAGASIASLKILTSARILLVGDAQATDVQIALLKEGIRGYFDLSSPVEQLYDALHRILHGEVWVKRDVISELVDNFAKEPAISPEQYALISQLTPKERDVADRVSHGATNKMIARAMNITERTVKAHLTAIFQKLDIPDRLALAILFANLR